MRGASNDLAELIRITRAACKAAREMAGLLAKGEREVADLRRELVEEVQAAVERARSESRKHLLAETFLTMRAAAASTASSALMESVLDGEALADQADMILADGEPRFVAFAAREVLSFGSELARAEAAVVKTRLENDTLISSLRSTLCELRKG
jgi:hypothetical protein